MRLTANRQALGLGVGAAAEQAVRGLRRFEDDDDSVSLAATRPVAQVDIECSPSDRRFILNFLSAPCEAITDKVSHRGIWKIDPLLLGFLQNSVWRLVLTLDEQGERACPLSGAAVDVDRTL